MYFLCLGCNPSASYSKEIENDLWLCAFDNAAGGTWEETYSACNQAGNFHLATVTSFTARGAPADSNILAAMNWAKSNSFNYVITGQPVRDAAWNDDKSSCTSKNDFGYINMNGISSSENGWKDLLDGNGNEGRSWPSGGTFCNYDLVSLCQDASSISDACIYDHRWRVGSFANCIHPSELG